jgi:hypothetical protein
MPFLLLAFNASQLVPEVPPVSLSLGILLRVAEEVGE